MDLHRNLRKARCLAHRVNQFLFWKMLEIALEYSLIFTLVSSYMNWSIYKTTAMNLEWRTFQTPLFQIPVIKHCFIYHNFITWNNVNTKKEWKNQRDFKHQRDWKQRSRKTTSFSKKWIIVIKNSLRFNLTECENTRKLIK